MSVFQTFMPMIAFASLILSIISFKDKENSPIGEPERRGVMSSCPYTLYLKLASTSSHLLAANLSILTYKK
ncbi:putative holin-like toxin [Metabacillus halosaccharovorans]|uniref:putative holin-like toxin n=1 Tax=Metabacillus halosaccharovorans TaxID=930124 RepID=UPI003736787B